MTVFKLRMDCRVLELSVSEGSRGGDKPRGLLAFFIFVFFFSLRRIEKARPSPISVPEPNLPVSAFYKGESQ